MNGINSGTNIAPSGTKSLKMTIDCGRYGKAFKSCCDETIATAKSMHVDQDPVVQSIVSLTISLRHKFVKQISAKVTNTLLFFC